MKHEVFLIDVKVNIKKTHVGIEFINEIPVEELNRIVAKIKEGIVVGLEFDYDYSRKMLKDIKEK